MANTVDVSRSRIKMRFKLSLTATIDCRGGTNESDESPLDGGDDDETVVVECPIELYVLSLSMVEECDCIFSKRSCWERIKVKSCENDMYWIR